MQIGNKIFDTEHHTAVMAILNVTPDSFSDGGSYKNMDDIRRRVSQMIEAHLPAVREQLGDDAWRTLIEAFIRQSEWSSPYYGDLKDDFLAYLARESA